MQLRDFLIMLEIENCFFVDNITPIEGFSMKILLADARPNIRYGLSVLLTEQPGLEIVGESDTLEELLAQIATCCPDLIILSWDFPAMEVEGFLRQIRRSCPALLVIALSAKPNLRQAALQAGADVFICKGDPPEKLLASLKHFRERQI